MEIERDNRFGRPEAGATAASAPRPRSLDSRELFAGGREVMIRHGESTYRLRSTNKGKLILTK